MKKHIALILALALLLAPAALAEVELNEPGLEIINGWAIVDQAELSPAPTGDWFGDLGGVPMKLTLNEDGTYALSSPAATDAPQAGTWEYRDGFVWLDGDEAAPFNLTAMLIVPDDESAESAQEEILSWTALGALFRRESLPAYVPADIEAAATLETMAGYWTSAFVSVGGEPVSAAALGDNTDLIIDGPRVALGGDMFGDVYVDFVFAGGTLSAVVSEDLVIAIALQQDGLLRLAIAQPEGELIVYLAKADTEN